MTRYKVIIEEVTHTIDILRIILYQKQGCTKMIFINLEKFSTQLFIVKNEKISFISDTNNFFLSFQLKKVTVWVYVCECVAV